jgi:predicted amidophosphoribosyltransferase
LADKLTRIDESNIGDHSLLTSADEVYFWREYTSHRNYSFGPGNDLISNLKKKPSTANIYERKHKVRVIRECSAFFAQAIDAYWLDHATFVPIPGSKAVGHPDYDDRMSQIFRGIRAAPPIDVREIVLQQTSIIAAHEAGAGARPTVQELIQNYAINESKCQPVPELIGIVDDVLTAGAHYRATHKVLSDRFPGVRIAGLFVARRVFPPDEGPTLI